MNVRYKHSGMVGVSNCFNTHSTDEVIVLGAWGSDSSFISDLVVQIDSKWVDMRKAFNTHLIVPNNANTHFAPPQNKECKERGYND